MKKRMSKHTGDIIGTALITFSVCLLTAWLGFAYYHDAHSDKHHGTDYLPNWMKSEATDG